MTYPRSLHLRETAERAARYFREQNFDGLERAVISACGTMLFKDATEYELSIMRDAARKEASKRPRR